MRDDNLRVLARRLLYACTSHDVSTPALFRLKKPRIPLLNH